MEGVLTRPPTSQLPTRQAACPTSMPVAVVHSTVIDPTATTSAIPTPTPTTLPTTDSRRPASKLFPRMVSTDRQSMDPFRRTRRLQNPLSSSTSTIALAPTYCSLQSPSTTALTPRNSRFTIQKSNRTSTRFGISRLLQPNVRDTQKERRVPTDLQSQGLECLCSLSAFQNGKHPAGDQTDQQRRLFHFSGSHRRLPPHSDSSTIPKVSSLSMGGPHLPISDHSLWPIGRPVAFYSPDQAHPIVGPPTRHEDIRISRRLDSDRQVSTTSTTTNNSSAASTADFRLDDQYQKVPTPSYSGFGSPRIPTGQPNYDDTATWPQDTRFTSLHLKSSQTSDSNPTPNSQPNYAHLVNHISHLPSQSTHSSANVLQEQPCENQNRLGSPPPSSSQLSLRTTMVAHQPQSMELTFSLSHEPRAYHMRRRKRQRLGRSLSSKIRTRLMDGAKKPLNP